MTSCTSRSYTRSITIGHSRSVGVSTTTSGRSGDAECGPDPSAENASPPPVVPVRLAGHDTMLPDDIVSLLALQVAIDIKIERLMQDGDRGRT